MLYTILDMFQDIASNCSAWFISLFNATETYPLFIAVIAMGLSIRFLVFPLLGKGLGSDKATTKRKENTDG